MRLPVIQGLIRRRLLVNFRVDVQVMADYLLAPFRPKLHLGYAVAGVCLIRLEQIRPAGLPSFCGLSSENVAHRIAVEWDEPTGASREGVFIPRRDTGSWLNHWAGGRVFPGEHHLADFAVEDDGAKVTMSMRSRDGQVSIKLRAHETDTLPSSSCFGSLAESSAFFEGGCVGYSVTGGGCRLDGLRLQTEGWCVRPLAVEQIESSFFADESAFPAGSVAFDHALVMRDVVHRWHQEADLFSGDALDVQEKAEPDGTAKTRREFTRWEKISYGKGMNDATNLPIPDDALVEVHPGPGSQAPEGLARVYRQDSDNYLVFVRYYSPLEFDGEEFGVLPGEVVVVPETNLTKN